MKHRAWFVVDKREGKSVGHVTWGGEYYPLNVKPANISTWDLQPCDICNPDVVWVYVEGEFDE
jgi:hypothetical protein